MPSGAVSDPRARIRRIVIIGAVGIALVWLVVAVVSGIAASVFARAGADQLEATAEALSPEDLLRGDGVDDLRAAHRDFDRAQRLTASPLFWPVRVLPVLGRQLDAFTTMAATSRSTVAAGIDALEALHDEIPEDERIPPDERASLLRRIATVASDLEANVHGADLGPSNGLVGPLADARDQLERELTDLQSGLERGIAVTGTVADLLESDGDYLVLITNNAEMRAGAPMILRVGLLSFEDGTIDLHDLQDVGLPLETPVEADEDLLANWAWLEPAQRWRNAGVTARFDVVAEVAEGIWRAKGGAPVEGVVALDVVALEAILRATGPVDVEGREIDAQTIRSELFIAQYEAGFDRQEHQADIARAVVGALEDGDWEWSTMAEQLRIAANGRHLLAWSSNPAQQEAWERAGIAGTLTGESLMASLINLGGNKLDPFIDVDASMAVEDVDDGWLVRTEFTLRNEAPPPGEVPDLVLGPFPGTMFEPGEYVGAFTVAVPAGARDVGLDGGDHGIVRGPDGPTTVVGSVVSLPRGEQRSLVVTFVLPRQDRTLVVEPSARVPAIRWRSGDLTWVDHSEQRLRW